MGRRRRTPRAERPADDRAIALSGIDTAADEDFAYVTTAGRRTGRPHTIEIWFGVDGGRVYLLSGGGEQSDWVRNLLADPRVGLRIRDRWQAEARVVGDPEEEARARRLLASKYQGWQEGRPLSRWATTALPVALDLTGP